MNDIYIILFFTALSFILCLLVSRRFKYNKSDKILFSLALLGKIIGAIVLGMLYKYHYNGYDTFELYACSQVLNNAFSTDPEMYLKLLMLDAGVCEPETMYWTNLLIPKYFDDLDSFFFIKLLSVINIISFQNYWGTATLLAILSFSASWMVYRKLILKVTEKRFLIAVSVLFVPSVLFWGSGVLKDTLGMTALAFIIYGALSFINNKNWKWIPAILLAIGCLLLYYIKPYLLLLNIAVASITWCYFVSRKLNLRLRVIVMSSFLILLLFFSFKGPMLLNSKAMKWYSLWGIKSTINMHRNWNTISGDANYSLGNVSNATFMNTLAMFPAGVNVTLFRPYPWEMKNALMLLMSFESVFIMMFTMFVIYKVGVRKLFSIVGSDPIIFHLFITAITLAFFLGVATYNFGALSRYRIPVLWMYLISLVLIYIKNSEFKQLKSGQ